MARHQTDVARLNDGFLQTNTTLLDAQRELLGQIRDERNEKKRPNPYTEYTPYQPPEPQAPGEEPPPAGKAKGAVDKELNEEREKNENKRRRDKEIRRRKHEMISAVNKGIKARDSLDEVKRSTWNSINSTKVTASAEEGEPKIYEMDGIVRLADLGKPMNITGVEYVKGCLNTQWTLLVDAKFKDDVITTVNGVTQKKKSLLETCFLYVIPTLRILFPSQKKEIIAMERLLMTLGIDESSLDGKAILKTIMETRGVWDDIYMQILKQ